mmetsp:Transcript_41426/g.104125  ORF Transcript_41426/g.104125 Transcript_41426/m.104125 type:complete len:355 (-) Transcript_41426:1756-2820(-)
MQLGADDPVQQHDRVVAHRRAALLADLGQALDQGQPHAAVGVLVRRVARLLCAAHQPGVHGLEEVQYLCGLLRGALLVHVVDEVHRRLQARPEVVHRQVTLLSDHPQRLKGHPARGGVVAGGLEQRAHRLPAPLALDVRRAGLHEAQHLAGDDHRQFLRHRGVQLEDEVQGAEQLVRDLLLVRQQPLAHPQQAEHGALHEGARWVRGPRDDRLQVRVHQRPQQLDAVAVADGHPDQQLQAELRGVGVLEGRGLRFLPPGDEARCPDDGLDKLQEALRPQELGVAEDLVDAAGLHTVQGGLLRIPLALGGGVGAVDILKGDDLVDDSEHARVPLCRPDLGGRDALEAGPLLLALH